MEHALVFDNDVIMSPPGGVVFGDFSAGIEVRGFAQDNVIANNRIRGRARAALAVYVANGGSQITLHPFLTASMGSRRQSPTSLSAQA
jgi:hypothetical protein